MKKKDLEEASISSLYNSTKSLNDDNNSKLKHVYYYPMEFICKVK